MNEEQIMIVLIAAIGLISLIYFWLKNKTEKEILIAVGNLEKQDDFLLRIERIKEEVNTNSQIELSKQINNSEERLIQDSIRRSKSVTKGKIVEHFAPFIIGDWIKPSETIFGGSPIDLISFRNINQGKEVSIDFIEIKTGNSFLSKKQRLIRDAINSNRVYYKEVKLK